MTDTSLLHPFFSSVKNGSENTRSLTQATPIQVAKLTSKPGQWHHTDWPPPPHATKKNSTHETREARCLPSAPRCPSQALESRLQQTHATSLAGSLSAVTKTSVFLIHPGGPRVSCRNQSDQPTIHSPQPRSPGAQGLTGGFAKGQYPSWGSRGTGDPHTSSRALFQEKPPALYPCKKS